MKKIVFFLVFTFCLSLFYSCTPQSQEDSVISEDQETTEEMPEGIEPCC